jgi:hypothetical protein
MNPYNKSDVKNHLSTRGGKNVLPFRPASQPDAASYPGNERSSDPVLPADTLVDSDSSSEPLIVKKPQA